MPRGIGGRAEAEASEGVRNVSTLIAAWHAGEQRFDLVGAALFAAMDGDVLAAVGGVKRETALAESALRMHRFCVHPMYRRPGMGRDLAQTVMDHALSDASGLTCNARATPLAAPFWEALGFLKAEADG
ncbi:GNAT family N-acetyltransferase [Hyphomonas sp.]|uniref:GNAT family N-acetyltransferase n=1 Tax=Hyphomonas sp. TaxID=87 RepID=UPI003341D609